MKCSRPAKLMQVFCLCVLTIEFRNWNLKYFIIDWEMTLTLFFHDLALCRAAFVEQVTALEMNLR